MAAWGVATIVGTLGPRYLVPRSPEPIGLLLGDGPVVEMWLAGVRWRGISACGRVVSDVGLY